MNKMILAGLSMVNGCRLWFVRHDGDVWHFERKTNALEFIKEHFTGDLKARMIRQINSPKWKVVAC